MSTYSRLIISLVKKYDAIKNFAHKLRNASCNFGKKKLIHDNLLYFKISICMNNIKIFIITYFKTIYKQEHFQVQTLLSHCSNSLSYENFLCFFNQKQAKKQKNYLSFFFSFNQEEISKKLTKMPPSPCLRQ